MLFSDHFIRQVSALSRQDLEELALTLSACRWMNLQTGLPDPTRKLDTTDCTIITNALVECGLTLPDPDRN